MAKANDNKEKILLFIPMYNCKAHILKVLDQLSSVDFLTEVIVVNNRSTDGGDAAVEAYLKANKMNVKTSLFTNVDNYGLGGSHKVAFNYAMDHDFDYVIVLHGDNQGQINDLAPLIEAGMHRSYDCLLGARFKKDSKLVGYSKFRIFGNRVFNIIFSIFLGFRVFDLGAGINMYRVNMLKTKFYYQYPENLAFNCFMLEAIKAYKQRYYYFPITWTEDGQISNVKMMSQAIFTLKQLFRFWLKGKIFLEMEHRDIVRETYASDLIAQNKG